MDDTDRVGNTPDTKNQDQGSGTTSRNSDTADLAASVSQDTAFDTFKSVLVLARIWDYLVTSSLRKNGITAQQLIFLSVISTEFPSPPTLNQAARTLCMTHQNVRQLIDILERRGLVEVRPDSGDRRTLRIHVTAPEFQYSVREKADISRLLQPVTRSGLAGARKNLDTLLQHARDLYQKARRGEDIPN
jgi:hypothetical protein